MLNPKYCPKCGDEAPTDGCSRGFCMRCEVPYKAVEPKKKKPSKKKANP